MTERQLKQFRQQLIERLTELYRTVHQDIREAPILDLFTQEESPRDEGDESLRDQLRDLRLSLREQDARLAQTIEGALMRMAEGTFGRCVECGNKIEIGRLRAVPWAARCVDCQESVESEHRMRPPTL